MPQEAYDALEKAREKFYEILNDHNIGMDEILK